MPDWKVVAHLTAFLAAFAAFILLALDPAMQSREAAARIWSALEDWQTLIAGVLAIAAAIIALFAALHSAKIQAKATRDAASRQAEAALAQARATYSTVEHQLNTDINREIQRRLSQKQALAAALQIGAEELLKAAQLRREYAKDSIAKAPSLTRADTRAMRIRPPSVFLAEWPELMTQKLDNILAVSRCLALINEIDSIADQADAIIEHSHGHGPGFAESLIGIYSEIVTHTDQLSKTASFPD